MSFKYEIGSHVRLVIWGRSYSTLTDVASNMSANAFKYGLIPNAGIEGIVMNRCEHPRKADACGREEFLYLVRSEDKDFVLGESGLELISYPPPSTFERVIRAEIIKLGGKP